MKKYFLLLVVACGLISHASASDWTGGIEVNPMNDTKTYFASTSSLGAVWAATKAALSAGMVCATGSTSLWITHPFVIGDGPVTVRLDANPSSTFYAERSDGGKSLFIGGIGNAEREGIFSAMTKAKTMLVQYKDVAKTTFVAKFSLRGFAAHFKKMNATCKPSTKTTGPSPATGTSGTP